MPGPSEVVGVIGDVRNQNVSSDPQAEIYLPWKQLPWANVHLVVRTNGEPHAVAAAIRRGVLAVDKDQPVNKVRSMEEVFEEGAAQPRFTTWLLGGLSTTALLLAIVGIYSVIAYTVSDRTQEMGIRIALGADRNDILRLVLRQGLTMAGAGIAVGLLFSFVLTRLLATLLYRVSATDPFSFIAGPLLFAAVALAASYLPARRATRVDPVLALRN